MIILKTTRQKILKRSRLTQAALTVHMIHHKSRFHPRNNKSILQKTNSPSSKKIKTKQERLLKQQKDPLILKNKIFHNLRQI